MKTHMHKWIKWIVIAACVALLAAGSFAAFSTDYKEPIIEEAKPAAETEKTVYVLETWLDYYDEKTDEFIIYEIPKQDNNIEAPSDMPKTDEEREILDRNLPVLEEALGKLRADAINDRLFAYYRKGDIPSLRVAEAVKRGVESEIRMDDGSEYIFKTKVNTVTSIKEKSVADGDYVNYIYTLYRPLPQYD